MDIQTIGTSDNFERLAQGKIFPISENIRIISDAEKAFISFMKSKYNSI